MTDLTCGITNIASNECDDSWGSSYAHRGKEWKLLLHPVRQKHNCCVLDGSSNVCWKGYTESKQSKIHGLFLWPIIISWVQIHYFYELCEDGSGPFTYFPSWQLSRGCWRAGGAGKDLGSRSSWEARTASGVPTAFSSSRFLQCTQLLLHPALAGHAASRFPQPLPWTEPSRQTSSSRADLSRVLPAEDHGDFSAIHWAPAVPSPPRCASQTRSKVPTLP